jgi:hypothetical protein
MSETSTIRDSSLISSNIKKKAIQVIFFDTLIFEIRREAILN